MIAWTFLMCLVCLGPSAARSSNEEKDLKAMEGTWLPSMAELGGEPFKDDQLRKMKLVLKGDKYVTHVGDQTDEGTIKLDPSKKPKTMDITGGEGPNKGKTFLCIYEQKDDTLRICYDLGGKQRPTDFNTKKDTLLFLVTYKRDKR